MEDEFNLSRFLEAQKDVYQTALNEIKSGRKKSHWMWFIFPQVIGLGSTEISIKYSIMSKAEAKAYLSHPVLGKRLVEISSELLKMENLDAFAIFGKPDNRKLQSCMTLFSEVSNDFDVFNKVLEKYFDSEKDIRTLQILEAQV